MQGVHFLEKLGEKEAKLGLTAGADAHGSWHDEYKGSAYIFVGGISYDLNEGDLITVFSQYGRVVRANLIRDKASGKSKGYAFLCYEDERSTILAVDNLNGITLAGRVIQFVSNSIHAFMSFFFHLLFCSCLFRVNHVKQYRKKKESTDLQEGVVPENPSAPPPATAEDGDLVGLTPAAKRAREEALRDESNKSTVAGADGDGEEEAFEMNSDLEALEAKIQHAEKRLEKWERKYAKAKRHAKPGETPSITEEEYIREKKHIEHVLQKYQRQQQRLWDAKPPQ